MERFQVVILSVMTLLGCAESNEGPFDIRDGALDASLDASAEYCLSVCRDGVPQLSKQVCFVTGYGMGQPASAALYQICLVDPEGVLYLTRGRGDHVFITPGWTHSGYSNGLVASTLSEEDGRRCADALAESRDAGVVGCLF